MPDDPFRILGVAHSATAEQIADAWRTKMRGLHPDANAGAGERELADLTRRTAVVNAAYNALKSDLEGERARHDPAAGADARTQSSVQRTAAAQWTPTPPMLPARIPGGWLFRRPITWVLLFGALIAGLFILNSVGTPQPSQNPGTPTSYVAPVGWYPGNCLAGTQVVVPVRCTTDHTAKITDRVGAVEYCPEGTDATVFRDNVYFCVDKDQ